jgi:DivIVA domain-containing protein
MIDLTPLEVRKKKGDFRRIMRGYDPTLVDDFLDLVADRLDELVRENIGLSERVASQEQQVAEFRDRERALTEALVTAQEMREEMRQQTSREAELVRRTAEQQAAELRSRTEQETSELRSRTEQETTQLRSRTEAEMTQLRSRTEAEVAQLRTTALQEAAQLRGAAQAGPGAGRARVPRAAGAPGAVPAGVPLLPGAGDGGIERRGAGAGPGPRRQRPVRRRRAAAAGSGGWQPVTRAETGAGGGGRCGAGDRCGGGQVDPGPETALAVPFDAEEVRGIGPTVPASRSMCWTSPRSASRASTTAGAEEALFGVEAGDEGISPRGRSRLREPPEAATPAALEEVRPAGRAGGFEPEPLEPFAPEPFEPLDGLICRGRRTANWR